MGWKEHEATKYYAAQMETTIEGMVAHTVAQKEIKVGGAMTYCINVIMYSCIIVYNRQRHTFAAAAGGAAHPSSQASGGSRAVRQHHRLRHRGHIIYRLGGRIVRQQILTIIRS